MVLVTQLGGLVQTIVASTTVAARETYGLAVASIAASTIAWLIFMLPHSIATVSIATASFTKISTHAHDKDMSAFKTAVGSSLRVIVSVSALSAAVLMVLAYPVSRVFVGELAATFALGNVLIAMLIGLVPFSFGFMLQRAFYALEDTRTPFFFTLVQTVLFITGAVAVAFTVNPVWLVAALALVNSLAITVQAVLAYRLLRRKVGRFEGVGLAGASARMVLAAMAAGGVGFGALWFSVGLNPGSFALASVLGAVLSSICIGLLMVVVYVVILRLLQVEEAKIAITAVGKAVRFITRR
jgi:putative peptidoglycan lipid II flippase